MHPIVFFGSAPFSVIVLEKVLGSRCQVLAVITTPDRPVGRHLKLTPNPVKVLAQKHNINIQYSVSNIQFEPGVIGLVAAYGKIIPQEILDKFNGQIYNIHPSLLPKYRGPSPLQQQILDGVTETGVTIIQLDAQMDHGPIVAQVKDKILSNDTWITLGERLFDKGAELFINLLNNSPLLFPSLNLREGLGVSYIPQNHNEATFTKLLTRQDGFIPYEKFNFEIRSRSESISKFELSRKLRAFAGWPGVWTIDPAGKRVKLISLDPEIIIQPEGRSPLPWSQYVSGHKT